MATTTSLSKERPLLESVFGPISADEDLEIRDIFAQCDEQLLALARHFGRDGAGWEKTGLELVMMPSGQVEISSFVETCVDGDGGKCVSFCVNLLPGWYYTKESGKSDERAWDIEVEIYADCQHHADCCGMHLVHELTVNRADKPREAAMALQSAVEQLARLAVDTPLLHWLKAAGQ